MKRYGYVWERGDEPHSWVTTLADKFELHVERHHSLREYHCWVDYNGARIWFKPKETRDAAMKTVVKWTEDLIQNGPPTPEQVIQEAFDRFPSLFLHRNHVFNQLFFVIGNGFEWVEGGLVNTMPEEREEPREPSWLPEIKAAERLTPNLKERIDWAEQELRKRTLWRFYPVGKYSAILNLPDNIRPEWFEAAKEAALLLTKDEGSLVEQVTEYPENRDKNRAIGRELCEKWGVPLDPEEGSNGK